MASQQLTASYDAAVKAQAQQPAEAIRLFRDIALGSHSNDADSVKVRRRWELGVYASWHGGLPLATNALAARITGRKQCCAAPVTGGNIPKCVCHILEWSLIYTLNCHRLRACR
jgi:hypothetical protein